MDRLSVRGAVVKIPAAARSTKRLRRNDAAVLTLVRAGRANIVCRYVADRPGRVLTLAPSGVCNRLRRQGLGGSVRADWRVVRAPRNAAVNGRAVLRLTTTR